MSQGDSLPTEPTEPTEPTQSHPAIPPAQRPIDPGPPRKAIPMPQLMTREGRSRAQAKMRQSRLVRREVDLLYRPEHLTQKLITKIQNWWSIGKQSVGRILGASNRIRANEHKTPLIYADVYACLTVLRSMDLINDRPSGLPQETGLMEMNLAEFKLFYQAWKAGYDKMSCYRLATMASFPAGVALDEQGLPPPLPNPICTQSFYDRVLRGLTERWSKSKTKSGRALTNREKVNASILDYAQLRIVEGGMAIAIPLTKIPPHIFRWAWESDHLDHLIGEETLRGCGLLDFLHKIRNPSEEEPTEQERMMAMHLDAMSQAQQLQCIDNKTPYAEEVETGSLEEDGSPSLKSPLDDDELGELDGFEEQPFESLSNEDIDTLMSTPTVENLSSGKKEELP